MKKSFIIQLAVSLALLAALLYFADVGEVLRIISRSNLLLLAFAFVFYFCINVAMAYRIKRVLAYFRIKLAFSKILLSHFAGMLASDFTPARSGYFTTAFVLNANNKIPLERAMVSILGPQLFD
ncbi:MAG: flippase-like domain-containing protein, partial [Candidatus Micrarchaeota archaeon]